MSEPIKVGDLVVVRYSCCSKRVSHWIFRVGRFHESGWAHGAIHAMCAECSSTSPDVVLAGPAVGIGVAQPVSWLKRIPPLSELEGEQNREELTA